jgi:hypothetical protein
MAFVLVQIIFSFLPSLKRMSFWFSADNKTSQIKNSTFIVSNIQLSKGIAMYKNNTLKSCLNKK